MIHYRTSLAAAVTAGALVLSFGPRAQAATDPAGPQQFVTKAVQGGRAEIKLSELAKSKTQNAKVRKIATEMVADHGKSNADLESIARTKGLTVPQEVDTAHQATLDTLSAQSGAAFDAAYLDAMEKEHADAVALFEAEGGSPDKDSGLKAFAVRTLPTLKMHRSMVSKAVAANGSRRLAIGKRQ